MRNEWDGIGIMSGTSLDGIDLAWCHFSRKEDGGWKYCIEMAVTVPFTDDFRQRLADAPFLSALEYVKLNNDVAYVFADAVNDWLGNGLRPDFLASHGHTVFHQPEIGLTTQIGNGAVLAAKTKILTVCDFRTKDVALGGQGAPLVPIGDELLFSEYDACLNLGGIANISYRVNDKRIAYDISPCNMALNPIAQKRGQDYDRDGEIAQKGEICPELFEKLNALGYYRTKSPKSLGKEWYQEVFLGALAPFSSRISDEDLARTVVEHVACQVASNVPVTACTLLATGGGAHNKFLIKRIQNRLKATEVIVPHDLIVDYKEALVFAFLGLLRLNGENNCLRSVTGAKEDSCSGCIY